MSSFSFGSSNLAGTHGFGGGSAQGKVAAHELTISEPTGKQSSQLLKATATGAHYKELRFQARKVSSEQVFIRYCLEDVVVSSYKAGTSNNVSSESVSFNYGKLATLYSPANSDLGAGCKSGKGGGAPSLDGWVIKMRKSSAKLGVACLSSHCNGSIEMVAAGTTLGQAKFKLKGGAAKTLTVQISGNGRTKLKKHPGVAVALIGSLKGQGSKLLRENVLPAVQRTPGRPSSAVLGPEQWARRWRSRAASS